MKEAEFEDEFVHKFYDKKSGAFSDSRVKPWPFTLDFMREHATDGSLVLDSGCGNGRQFISENTVGLDYSAPLLRSAASRRNLGLVRGNVHSLPFRDGTFDIALSIAVVHHLSTHERRLRCLTELCRVLRPGGRCLVYAWHSGASSKAKFQHIKDTEYLVSWRGETDALRYYFLFDEQLLVSLCREAGFTVVGSGIEQESVYAVAKKED